MKTVISLILCPPQSMQNKPFCGRRCQSGADVCLIYILLQYVDGKPSPQACENTIFVGSLQEIYAMRLKIHPQTNDANCHIARSSATIILSHLPKGLAQQSTYASHRLYSQSNVVQLGGGMVETSFLLSLMVSKPKRSPVPLLFPVELSKSRDADGLFNCGEFLFGKSKEPP